MWEDTIERNVSHQVQNLDSLEEEIDAFSKKVYKYTKENKASEKESGQKSIKEINHKFQEYTKQFQDDSLKMTKLKKLKKQFQQLEEQFLNHKEKTVKQTKILEEEEDDVIDLNKREEKQQEKLQEKKITLSKAQQATLNVELEIAKETRHQVFQLENEMVELKQCFQDLEDLVQEQQVKMDTIEENVTEGVKNSEVAVQNIKIAGQRTITNSVINVGSNCEIQ